MLGPIISENDPPFFAPWVTSAHQSCKKSEALKVNGRAGRCSVLKALFLAHQIRTSEILPWDRKSYLTHVILPRLSHKGCTLVVLELTGMVVKPHYSYVKLTSSCHVASQHIHELLEAFLKHKMQYLMVSKKGNPLFGLEWDRKIRP